MRSPQTCDQVYTLSNTLLVISIHISHTYFIVYAYSFINMNNKLNIDAH